MAEGPDESPAFLLFNGMFIGIASARNLARRFAKRKFPVKTPSRESKSKRPVTFMKKILLTLAFVSVLTGCAHRYTITLSNRNQITALTKPRLEHGNYYFKDASGQDAYVPAGRVVEIAPESMTKQNKEPFKPQRK